MYSYTQTNIHLLHPPLPNQPSLSVICRCSRRLLQQQIYTCLSCCSYSCHFCTVPEFSSYQCRSCKKIYESGAKGNKCNACYACPYCQNVLIMAKDPQSKLLILMCQFCFWSTKEIHIKEERYEILFDTLAKLSAGMRDHQARIYSHSQKHFKQCVQNIENENQAMKYLSGQHKKAKYGDSNAADVSVAKVEEEKVRDVVKRVGLEDEGEEYTGGQNKYPQALPLLTKKTRRCPTCTKPLTNLYKPSRSNELKIELMYKEFRVLQCQLAPPTDRQVKVRFMHAAKLESKEYQPGEIVEVQVGKEFTVGVKVQNKTKGTVGEVGYVFVVEGGK